MSPAVLPDSGEPVAGVGRGNDKEGSKAHHGLPCGRRRGGDDANEPARRSLVAASARAVAPARWKLGQDNPRCEKLRVTWGGVEEL